jgi:hypothetical protein
MEIKYCDMCGKEIKKECITVHWHKGSHFNYRYWSKEFCSRKCLFDYLTKIKWMKTKKKELRWNHFKIK